MKKRKILLLPMLLALLLTGCDKGGESQTSQGGGGTTSQTGGGT
ncbi:MAG: C4-dicarboxylate ABC transporter substrate-binding protein, partial [Erysipelotrichaceae bacterium]|nr:C4-dicarboxylate ABC transporter substrate-binding protein [Erysipelotrichaceae bacterium]